MSEHELTHPCRECNTGHYISIGFTEEDRKKAEIQIKCTKCGYSVRGETMIDAVSAWNEREAE